MITSKGFYYDNEYSGNKNVIKAITSNGAVTDTFLGTVSNKVVKNKNNIKSFILDSDNEPIVIPMALYFEKGLDDSSIRHVKKWLAQDDFKELVFEDQPDKVYYAKLDGSSVISHNAISEGFVEFDFLTNSAYSFSRPHLMEGESISSSDFELLQIYNDGDLTTFPKITVVIDPLDAADVEIINDSTGERFLLKNNLVNESIVIWNEYDELETSSNLRHGYDDHLGDFISFAEGVNDLRLKGKFKYTIEYQAIYL